MVKRAGNLIERIAGADNVRLAYLKARRGKTDRNDVRRFTQDLDSELDLLVRELASGTVHWGGYHPFRVYDPKPRTIHAPRFRARVAHHAILNVCEPVFESFQIHDSYACRVGKGLDAALKRTVAFSRHGHWFLKLDVRKYFDSISHDLLKEMLRRRFKDQTVLCLFDSIIDTYETGPGRGLPIGNLTSQYFANHYLGVVDHYMKEIVRCGRYLRYMDDIVIWSSDKGEMLSLRRTMEDFLEHCLRLKVKTLDLNACDRGMTFLGYRVYPGAVRLARRTRERFRRKASCYVRLWQSGVWDEADLALHMEPLFTFVKRGASRSFRERVIRDCGLCPEVRTA